MKNQRGIYCKQCWYDLRGIESRQCPECAKYFDPNESKSYSKYPGTNLPIEAWVVFGMQASAVLLYLITLIGVRVIGIEFGGDYWLAAMLVMLVAC